MPISSSVRMTRMAISPRLATRTLVNTGGKGTAGLPRAAEALLLRLGRPPGEEDAPGGGAGGGNDVEREPAPRCYRDARGAVAAGLGCIAGNRAREGSVRAVDLQRDRVALARPWRIPQFHREVLGHHGNAGRRHLGEGDGAPDLGGAGGSEPARGAVDRNGNVLRVAGEHARRRGTLCAGRTRPRRARLVPADQLLALRALVALHEQANLAALLDVTGGDAALRVGHGGNGESADRRHEGEERDEDRGGSLRQPPHKEILTVRRGAVETAEVPTSRRTSTRTSTRSRSVR